MQLAGMGKQTSIPCDSEVRDRLSNDKPDNMSWSAFLSKLHSDGEIRVGETPEWGDAAALEIGEATGDLAEQLDRIESAAKEATNAAQNAERAAEELGGQR